MIKDEEYLKVLDAGLLLDHYYVLCNIKNGIALVKNRRMQGFINLLTKKEYIKDDLLTEKAMVLIKHCEAEGILPTITPSAEKGVTDLEFISWATKTHTACREKIKEITGRYQYYLKVQGREYPYLPGLTDFIGKLEKFIKVYQFTDLQKIEKCLLKHCTTRNQKMIYYIMREKGDAKSDLASDYENFEEIQDENTGYKSTQKHV